MQCHIIFWHVNHHTLFQAASLTVNSATRNERIHKRCASVIACRRIAVRDDFFVSVTTQCGFKLSL